MEENKRQKEAADEAIRAKEAALAERERSLNEQSALSKN
jgi:hypothetical protein